MTGVCLTASFGSCGPARHGVICRRTLGRTRLGIINALAATHDAAVQMIDTSIVRVHRHAACITRNRRQSMGRSRASRNGCGSMQSETGKKKINGPPRISTAPGIWSRQVIARGDPRWNSWQRLGEVRGASRRTMCSSLIRGTSHGDVPVLYLEVLPTLNVGVVVHIHDVPFPYNIPFRLNYGYSARNGPCCGTRQWSCKHFWAPRKIAFVARLRTAQE